MIDILAGFSESCERSTAATRPTVWAQYVDIWGDARGEFGVAECDDLGHACFALLAPWACIPTIAEARLVADTVTALVVCRLRVTQSGIFDPYWTVTYSMADDGTLRYDPPVSCRADYRVGPAVEAAKRGRRRGTLWGDDYTLEAMIEVVADMLGS